MRAAPADKPWLPIHTGMLTKQAELSLLGGDFDHFDDEGGALLPDKEVSHESCVVCAILCQTIRPIRMLSLHQQNVTAHVLLTHKIILLIIRNR